MDNRYGHQDNVRMSVRIVVSPCDNFMVGGREADRKIIAALDGLVAITKRNHPEVKVNIRMAYSYKELRDRLAYCDFLLIGRRLDGRCMAASELVAFAANEGINVIPLFDRRDKADMQWIRELYSLHFYRGIEYSDLGGASLYNALFGNEPEGERAREYYLGLDNIGKEVLFDIDSKPEVFKAGIYLSVNDSVRRTLGLPPAFPDGDAYLMITSLTRPQRDIWHATTS